MNDPALFLAGVLVTMIVGSALALLVWGAILDGREQARQRSLRRGEQLRAAGQPAVRADAQPAVGSLSDRVPPQAA